MPYQISDMPSERHSHGVVVTSEGKKIPSAMRGDGINY